MSQFFLSKKARNDLKEIAKYTYKTWGEAQCDRYIGTLDEVFSSIANGALQGHDYYPQKGYKKYYIGKHVVFFRQLTTDTIQIVRILHQAMDVGSHI